MILKTFLACLKAEQDYAELKRSENRLRQTGLDVATIARIVSAVRDSTQKDVIVTIRTKDGNEVDFRAEAEKARKLPEAITDREILTQLTNRLGL